MRLRFLIAAVVAVAATVSAAPAQGVPVVIPDAPPHNARIVLEGRAPVTLCGRLTGLQDASYQRSVLAGDDVTCAVPAFGTGSRVTSLRQPGTNYVEHTAHYRPGIVCPSGWVCRVTVTGQARTINPQLPCRSVDRNVHGIAQIGDVHGEPCQALGAACAFGVTATIPNDARVFGICSAKADQFPGGDQAGSVAVEACRITALVFKCEGGRARAARSCPRPTTSWCHRHPSRCRIFNPRPVIPPGQAGVPDATPLPSSPSLPSGVDPGCTPLNVETLQCRPPPNLVVLDIALSFDPTGGSSVRIEPLGITIADPSDLPSTQNPAFHNVLAFVPPGMQITMTAKPGAGRYFVGWQSVAGLGDNCQPPRGAEDGAFTCGPVAVTQDSPLAAFFFMSGGALFYACPPNAAEVTRG